MPNPQHSGVPIVKDSHRSPALRVGLIGCGQWGANVATAADRSDTIELAAVSDIKLEAAAALGRGLASQPRIVSPGDLLDDESIDAVLVVTDADTHYDLALAAINNGKHVFVEKPLAMSSAQCMVLVDAAEAAGRTLMVGHTFLYSEHVAEVKRALGQGTLGDLRAVHMQRLAYGRFREDANVTWNLGPHDVSILMHWAGRAPVAIRCVEYMFTRPDISDLAFMTLDFGDFLGHVQLSSIDPEKVRRATIAGSAAGIVYDDVTGEVRLTTNGTNTPVAVPVESGKRPLDIEIGHLARCITTGARPKTDGLHGAMVVAVLEAAAESALSGGTWIDVPQPIPDPRLPPRQGRGCDPETKTHALVGHA